MITYPWCGAVPTKRWQYWLVWLVLRIISAGL